MTHGQPGANSSFAVIYIYIFLPLSENFKSVIISCTVSNSFFIISHDFIRSTKAKRGHSSV